MYRGGLLLALLVGLLVTVPGRAGVTGNDPAAPAAAVNAPKTVAAEGTTATSQTLTFPVPEPLTVLVLGAGAAVALKRKRR